MEAFILGLVALIVGALVAMYGVRVFFLLLPLWGFVLGFVFGSEAWATLFGEGFLATTTGWIIGIGFGALLAVLSGVVWWGAVVILAGGVGYAVGSGLLLAIGLDPGILTLAGGLALGAVVAGAAIVLDVPVALVALLTALGGSAYAVAGILLVFQQLTVDELRGGGPVGALAGHPVFFIAWLAFAAIAIGFQLLEMRRLRIEAIDRTRYRIA